MGHVGVLPYEREPKGEGRSAREENKLGKISFISKKVARSPRRRPREDVSPKVLTCLTTWWALGPLFWRILYSTAPVACASFFATGCIVVGERVSNVWIVDIADSLSTYQKLGQVVIWNVGEFFAMEFWDNELVVAAIDPDGLVIGFQMMRLLRWG